MVCLAFPEPFDLTGAFPFPCRACPAAVAFLMVDMAILLPSFSLDMWDLDQFLLTDSTAAFPLSGFPVPLVNRRLSSSAILRASAGVGLRYLFVPVS